MILEEAVQWCIEREADVSFSDADGQPFVYVYVDSYSGDTIEPIGEGNTLLEAVEQARKVFL